MHSDNSPFIIIMLIVIFIAVTGDDEKKATPAPDVAPVTTQVKVEKDF
jgi:hypothetical protein